MELVSAKDILAGVNFIELDSASRNVRHPKNEFQAYAYRLAHDLNDLEHLQIYMRLSKSIERSLMERAYSYVVDANVNEKGRLFLWKLKKLRGEIQRKRDMENFSYDFVAMKMAKVRDVLSDVIFSRGNVGLDTGKEEFIGRITQKKASTRKKTKVLIIGSSSPKLVTKLATAGFSVTGIDSSRKLTQKMKLYCTRHSAKGVKIIAKDFLKNSFIDHYFDYVIVNGFWSLIPTTAELKFTSEVKRILSEDGKLVLSYKDSGVDNQMWKVYMHNNEELLYFHKDQTKETMLTPFNKLGFRLLDLASGEDSNFFAFAL